MIDGIISFQNHEGLTCFFKVIYALKNNNEPKYLVLQETNKHGKIVSESLKLFEITHYEPDGETQISPVENEEIIQKIEDFLNSQERS